MKDSVYLGVDVGTGSARAGLFTATGRMLGAASHSIKMWKPQPEWAEQSSDDIWRACGSAIRAALNEAKLAPEAVRGVGFDATCSLVLLDAAEKPVAVTPGAEDERNIIVWMDHRAAAQADRINSKGHEVLKYVGGRVSPEMETPKLLWLKEKSPDAWKRAARFFDLADFLVYRATGKDVRSLCTTVCKWTYLGHEKSETSGGIGRWDAGYFREIGLGALVDEGFGRIGTNVRPMGELAGGLTGRAASELGLKPGTPVGVGIIDAHAGGLGLIGAALDGVKPAAETMPERIALIGGTSSCHMAVSPRAIFVPGVWGPYYSAMVPGMWLTEGGQSATGSLIDHVIFSHARSAELKEESARAGKTVYELLNERLECLAGVVEFPAALTKELHVLPYFHGNRSPRADASLRGMISGLRLSDSVDELALLYLATIQAVAYGTRHIIETMNQNGYRIRTIFACGGGTKNPVFLREHADITGCRVVLPEEPEAVLLGAAILGAAASSGFPSVLDAMAAMNRAGRSIAPATGPVSIYHSAKYGIFQRMYADQVAYRKIMDV